MAEHSAIFAFVLLVTVGLAWCGSQPLSCIGDSGQPVDWFIAYKLPKKVDTPLQDGYGYVYMDKDSNGFKVSKSSAADTTSAMGATLKPAYSASKDSKSSVAYIFYNDANPDGKEFFYRAHSKGDVVFNENGGFWLVHSVPKYPEFVRTGYGYPHSGTYYGQMFFCVSFNSSQIDPIGLQLRYNGPHIHDSNLPDAMKEKFPNIAAAINEDFIAGPPYNHSQRLVSSAGKTLIHFAKNKDFGADLYSSFVAPALQTNMLAETWQHGSAKTGSSCDGYTVENILQLAVKTDAQEFDFDNYADHAKFVVAKSSEKPYVCIGDINRMTTQFERGGGTLCVSDSYIWKAFRNFATQIDSC